MSYKFEAALRFEVEAPEGKEHDQFIASLQQDAQKDYRWHVRELDGKVFVDRMIAEGDAVYDIDMDVTEQELQSLAMEFVQMFYLKPDFSEPREDAPKMVGDKLKFLYYFDAEDKGLKAVA